jgi:hypothetical protein
VLHYGPHECSVEPALLVIVLTNRSAERVLSQPTV